MVIKLKEVQCLEGVCDHCGKTYALEEDFDNGNIEGSIRVTRDNGNSVALLAEFCSQDCFEKWVEQ